MTISKAQEKRIEENRKSFSKAKKDFLLSPVLPTKRQEVLHRNALISSIAKTKDIVLEEYTAASSLQAARNRMDIIFSKMAWWDELEAEAVTLVRGMNEAHAEAFYKTMSNSLGVNVAGLVNEEGANKLLESMIEVNVDQITELKSSTKKGIIDLLNNSIMGQELKSTTLSKQIKKMFNGISKNKAKFIARDQTQRAVNGLNRFRQQRAGIKKYKWVTSRDIRVRPSHRQMDGLEVNWETGKILTTNLSKQRGLAGKNVKKVAGGHIGQEFQCRCTASAILEV